MWCLQIQRVSILIWKTRKLLLQGARISFPRHPLSGQVLRQATLPFRLSSLRVTTSLFLAEGLSRIIVLVFNQSRQETGIYSMNIRFIEECPLYSICLLQWIICLLKINGYLMTESIQGHQLSYLSISYDIIVDLFSTIYRSPPLYSSTLRGQRYRCSRALPNCQTWCGDQRERD